jgi:hypothetical protein
MDSRQKAIEELKKQTRLARERLGPEGVKELEKLAKAMQKPKSKAPPAPKAPEGMIPYDKKAAAKAFEIFLKNHGDPKEFEKRLRELLKKSSH